jgi:hypothetical protein
MSKSKLPEYAVWASMRHRCTRPNFKGYKNYGGRGITYDPRWNSFDNFLQDMGRRPTPKHSLDRKDNNDHYYKGNCRWTTIDIQNKNKRFKMMNAHWNCTVKKDPFII